MEINLGKVVTLFFIPYEMNKRLFQIKQSEGIGMEDISYFFGQVSTCHFVCNDKCFVVIL
jgi:hypothetical protein